MVLPISIFEREGPHYFNSLVMVDADGSPAGRLPQEPHPRRAGLPGEVLLPARRHRLQGLGHPLRPARRRHLLGPVVPRGRPRHGADGRRGAVLSHRHRLGAARRLARHRAIPGGAPCRATRSPTSSRWSAPTASASSPGRLPGGGQTFYGSSFIADHRGDLVAELGREDEGVITAELRPRLPRHPPRRLGLLPRPPHRPLRGDRPGQGVREARAASLGPHSRPGSM